MIATKEEVDRLAKAATAIIESRINFEYPRYYEVQIVKHEWDELKAILTVFLKQPENCNGPEEVLTPIPELDIKEK